MAKLLIVDDRASNRELLRTALENAGHEIREAEDGASSLTAMREWHPDLVLMDIQMPGLDGYAVLERVLADPDLCQIPLIAVTAYAMQGDSQRGRQAGFRDYLTKPVQFRQLLAAVDRQLKGE